MRKLLLLAALAATMVLTVPGTALAECDASVSTEDAVEAARVVFVGEVVGLDNRDRTATFDVKWVWKGTEVPANATVLGGESDVTKVGPDDRYFQQGATYLVVSNSGAPPFLADLCSATRLYNAVGSTIPANLQAAVGSSTATKPVATVETVESGPGWAESRIIPWVVGAGAVFGLFLILGRATRGPERSATSTASVRGTKPARKRLPRGGRDSDRMAGWFRRSGDSQARRLRKQQKVRQRKLRKDQKADKAATRGRKGGLRTDRLAGQSSDDRDTKDSAGV